MADLTTGERLQPSLLDRLTDEERSVERESRDRRVLSMQRLRHSVLRDLTWLLNTDSLHADELEDHPEVARSVLNYGMRDLSGVTASSVDAGAMERLVRQVIRDFEPRLLRSSVKVRVLVADDQYNRNAVAFEIQALLWGQPAPLSLLLKTEVDLETGNVRVEEQSR